MAYYSPYTYEANSTFYIPPFNNNQHYSYILDDYTEPPPAPTQHEGQDYQSVNYTQPHSDFNLVIHPSSAAAQLGLTREEIQEVLEDQREWMREEEQRHEERVETQHPTETHHQQGEQNDDTDVRTAHPLLEYVHSTVYDMAHDNDAQAIPSEDSDGLDDGAVQAEPDHDAIEALTHEPVAPGNGCGDWAEDPDGDMGFNLQGEYTARYFPTPSPIPWYPPYPPTSSYTPPYPHYTPSPTRYRPPHTHYTP